MVDIRRWSRPHVHVFIYCAGLQLENIPTEKKEAARHEGVNIKLLFSIVYVIAIYG